MQAKISESNEDRGNARLPAWWSQRVAGFEGPVGAGSQAYPLHQKPLSAARLAAHA
jgi:hypothetical protein